MTPAIDARRLLVLLALSAAGLALTAPAGASAAKRTCSGPSVVSGGKARLVIGQEGGLFGCLRGSRRAVRITDEGFDDGFFGYWEKPRLAGAFAAVEVVTTHKCRIVEIEVMDLRSGEFRYFSAGSFSFSDTANGCEGGGLPTTDMVLRSDGAVAFIAGGTEVIRGGAREGITVTLERASTVEPTSLGLTRSGLVTWWSAGKPRSAVLPWRGPRR